MNCFSYNTMQCCYVNSLMFKVLLILINAPRHPPSLHDLHPNVLLVFLLNTTSFLELLDQGVVANFRMIYLQTLMCSLKVTDKPHKSSMLEFLEELQQVFEYILAAWDLITNNTTNGVWRECFHNFEGL